MFKLYILLYILRLTDNVSSTLMLIVMKLMIMLISRAIC